MSLPFCFVIMPFRPELHYFYLFMKRHIEDNHALECERGDAQILTKPVRDKVADYIRRADVLIADCTGRNANVFYELGFAHALDKQVILITQDDVTEAPVDVRHYEFVKYSLTNDQDFAASLDNALRNVFAGRYDAEYQRALELFNRFREATNARVIKASKESFVARLTSLERSGDFPEDDNGDEMARLLLPHIMVDPTDGKVMKQVTKWLSGLAKGSRPPGA